MLSVGFNADEEAANASSSPATLSDKEMKEIPHPELKKGDPLVPL